MRYSWVDERYSTLVKKSREYFENAKYSLWNERNKIKVVVLGQEEITLKSFKVPHFINRIVYRFFRASKAKKSYENSLKIVDFVPKPIGYVEYFRFGILGESYFLCEKFAYDFTVREPLLDDAFPDRERLFQAFAIFSFTLHEKGILHLDYSPGNILVKQREGQFLFKIVDVNRMRFQKLDVEQRLRNFSKLWAEDRDLESIIRVYAKLIDEDEERCLKVALYYSHIHKKSKERKKKLLGHK